jgi:hypothetical protein
MPGVSTEARLLKPLSQIAALPVLLSLIAALLRDRPALIASSTNLDITKQACIQASNSQNSEPRMSTGNLLASLVVDYIVRVRKLR